MNIISWNIGLTCEYFRHIFMGIKDNITASVDKISKQLLKFNGDVYLLQEVGYGFDNLNKKINHKFPYNIYIEELGLAVFSKSKIIPVNYSILKPDWFNYIFGFNNGYLLCYLPDYDKYVCNIHLSCGFNFIEQFKEISLLIDEINFLNLDKECILGGDFNFTRDKFNDFSNLFNIEYDLSNSELSYHYYFKINLDYFISSMNKKFRELKWRVIKTYESDHFPIYTVC